MITVGITGFSAGNGHPYSWSALINGFDKNNLPRVPFPAIRNYLGMSEASPAVGGAKVTHIWSEDRREARKVAKFADIENISDSALELARSVDVILHARDDYWNHEEFIQIYQKFRKPTFIDKPLATDSASLERLLRFDPDLSWLFSSSSLAFDRQISAIASSGQKFARISAFGPNSWDRYGIHLIEPVLTALNFPQIHKPLDRKTVRRSTNLQVLLSDGTRATFTTSGSPEKTFLFLFDSVELTITNPRDAFVNSLQSFLSFARGQQITGRRAQLEEIVKGLEMGSESN